MSRRILPPHGHISRYKHHGCKCLTCMDGWRDYSANVRRQQAYGRWQPMVDADLIRAHVNTLREAGLGIRRIAELADVAQSTISRLLYGKCGRPPQKQMQRAKANRILAIQPDSAAVADGAFVDPTGTRRRIQALVARGFTNHVIAEHLGTHPLYVGDLTTNANVTARHARAVTAVYDRLWDADPLQLGVTPRGAARSRNLAERNGWPPPAAWDDDAIDDPAARPHLGDDRRRIGQTQAEIEWLLAAGETDVDVIAARVGVAPDSVRRSMSRAARKADGMELAS
jgi:hypothetical protein